MRFPRKAPSAHYAGGFPNTVRTISIARSNSSSDLRILIGVRYAKHRFPARHRCAFFGRRQTQHSGNTAERGVSLTIVTLPKQLVSQPRCTNEIAL